LEIGAANDASEREADVVAAQVLRMPDPDLSMGAASPQVSSTSAAGTVAVAPRIVHDVARAPGRPLEPAARAFFEPRFGRDLSQVRVHTDHRAAESARLIDALAYTVGNNIVFGQGRYEPNDASGRHLLAHELAHTAQQDSHSKVRRFIRSGPTAPLNGYLHGKGILGVDIDSGVYSASRRGTANPEQEVLVDMLASPREFAVDGYTAQEAEKSLSAHVAARLGIVDFAAKKKYSFASWAGFRMNPLYYDLFFDKAKWKLKSGVDKQAAWQDLNLNPQLYAIGCAAATTLTQSGGSKGAEFRDQPSLDESDWVPGSAGYVTNNVYPSGADIGLLGENIIYVGSGLFWGHFSGNVTYRTLAEWKALVAKWHGGGAPGASEVDSKREYPTTGLA
jgi:hypothetical protein